MIFRPLANECYLDFAMENYPRPCGILRSDLPGLWSTSHQLSQFGFTYILHLDSLIKDALVLNTELESGTSVGLEMKTNNPVSY